MHHSFLLIGGCLVDSRIENWRIKLVDTIADNASSARLIVSQHRILPQELDLAAEGVELWCDGNVLGQGRARLYLDIPPAGPVAQGFEQPREPLP